jgi:hypothetical protein
MKSFIKFASAGLFLMSAPLLRADSVLFTLTAPDHVFSFELPSEPTPDHSGEDFENIPFFFINNVAVTVDGDVTNEGVLFSDNGDQHIAFADSWLVGSDGQVGPGLGESAAFFEEAESIFSGSNANPTFTPGTANGFFFEPGKEDEPPATLDIQTVAQTPEPSSLVLLGSGLLGFAGVMRRKLAISF